jgi:metal transporter CNNM
MSEVNGVLQEIISEEIVDETDRYEDNQSKRRARRMTTATVMRGFVFHYHSPASIADISSLKDCGARTKFNASAVF